MEIERFWLIRHAESTWNAAGRWQGQEDPPLSERGRTQASRLAAHLAAEGFGVVISSDLKRTRETAQQLAEAVGLEPGFEPGLRELDAGSWAGLTRSEIERRDGEALVRFDSGDPRARAGGGECRAEVAERAGRALLEIARAHPAARVAVVTHSGVVRSLLPEVGLGPAGWYRVAPIRLLPVLAT